MGTRPLLGVSAVLAWLFGFALLFASRAFEAPVGIVLDEKTATIAQAQGAILIGLGLINWLSRRVTDPQALTAVLSGNLLVQLASLAVALRAILIGLFPTRAAPAVVIHVCLGLWFGWTLVRISRSGKELRNAPTA